MTRDYVRSSRPAKRKPAGRNAPGRRGNTSNNAPFPMVRAVLALALVIGFGIFLYHISGSSGDTETVTTAQTASQAPIPIEQQRPAKEQFDYMQILQNKEVPVELPDGQVISDPSKDPQILLQQQKMQEMLRAQQERAKLLAQQQNGQLPADSMTLTQTVNPGTNQTINQPPPATRNQMTTVAPARTAETLEQKADPRKPKSFAEVLAKESGKSSKTAAAPVTKTATQERDEALAMFGKPRPYAADATRTSTGSKTTTPTSKRYMMQCGAFRTADQASSLQSRIAVQGQNAQVRTGSSTSGTWHRVILGPYSSRVAAEQSLSRLKAGGTVQNCTIYAQ